MRLNRRGNRQLNRALHTIATVQAAYHPPAREYLARKAAEQKSNREAIRAPKRQLVGPSFGSYGRVRQRWRWRLDKIGA